VTKCAEEQFYPAHQMWRKMLPSALPAPPQGAALRQKAPHKSQSPCPVLCPIRPNFFSTFKTLLERIILLIYHSDEGERGGKKESSKKTQQNSHYGIPDLQKKLMATE